MDKQRKGQEVDELGWMGGQNGDAAMVMMNHRHRCISVGHTVVSCLDARRCYLAASHACIISRMKSMVMDNEVTPRLHLAAFVVDADGGMISGGGSRERSAK